MPNSNSADDVSVGLPTSTLLTAEIQLILREFIPLLASTTKHAVLSLAQVMEMEPTTNEMSKETRTLKSLYMPLTFPLVQKPPQ
jgi:hypothetical protein